MVGRHLREARWFPAAHYPAGLLSPVRHRAVGHHPPQPWVTDEHGARVRLDDVVGSRWLLLHTGQARPWPEWTGAGVRTLELRPAGSPVSAGTVVDVDGVLTGWLRRTGAAALALRPDGFVYAAAGPDDALAPPPPELHVTADATEAHLTKGSR